MEIDNNGVRLHVAVDGDDAGSPILLLHGITQCLEAWDWFVADLVGRGHRVLRLDFRGHGRSGRAPGAYAFADYLADAVAVCREVALRPCAVVGHSLGGGTAAGLAQAHPALLRSIVLEDAPLSIRDTGPDDAMAAGFRVWRESMPVVQASGVGVAALAESLGAQVGPNGLPFGAFVHADGLATMARGMLCCDAEVLDPIIEGRVDPVYDPAVPLGVPTLALAADPSSPDAVTRPEDLARLAASGAHVETRVMTGASHLIHDQLDQRDLYRRLVLDFLDRTAGS